EDQIRLHRLRLEDRVLAVVAGHDLVAGLGQHIVEHVPLGRRIVDDQDALDCHGLPPFIGPCPLAARAPQPDWCAAALTWVATAFNRLSFVKGLVRYWSDPTMRPRARSNRPSFDDSMMTGVG